MRVSGRARRCPCGLGRRRWVLQSPGTSHPEERPLHPGPRCSPRPRHCPSAPWVGVFRASAGSPGRPPTHRPLGPREAQVSSACPPDCWPFWRICFCSSGQPAPPRVSGFRDIGHLAPTTPCAGLLLGLHLPLGQACSTPTVSLLVAEGRAPLTTGLVSAAAQTLPLPGRPSQDPPQ
ncbi:uncharacterized protein LOC113879831 [Bos indicus x Bos taurus]|uniref:uncharacterized protein LOC113879831 n=1 Tax=Bos indicus x Bos taurus TaxID=30522 RepID=UPI000F7D5969|nr:uncharacterized protein LOC113879831 [Bos indicus x Bos taurus]